MTQNHRPGELDDLAAHTRFLNLGANALVALGNITQPDCTYADEQLNGTRRSELAAVFSFFGQALRESSAIAENAVDILDMRYRETQKAVSFEHLTAGVAREMAAKFPEAAA